MSSVDTTNLKTIPEWKVMIHLAENFGPDSQIGPLHASERNLQRYLVAQPFMSEVTRDGFESLEASLLEYCSPAEAVKVIGEVAARWALPPTPASHRPRCADLLPREAAILESLCPGFDRASSSGHKLSSVCAYLVGQVLPPDPDAPADEAPPSSGGEEGEEEEED